MGENYWEEVRNKFLVNLGVYGLIASSLFMVGYYSINDFSNENFYVQKEKIIPDTLNKINSLDTLVLDNDSISPVKFKK